MVVIKELVVKIVDNNMKTAAITCDAHCVHKTVLEVVAPTAHSAL